MKKIIFVVLSFLLLSSCKKEEVKQFIIPNYGEDGKYVLEPLPGSFANVAITIWPSYDAQQSRIIVENRLNDAIAYIISEQQDPNFVYFSDNYIKAKGSSEQYGSQLPLNKKIDIRILVYNSTLSYALVVIIEGLGLDFWSSIEDYKENLREEYQGQLILKP